MWACLACWWAVLPRINFKKKAHLYCSIQCEWGSCCCDTQVRNSTFVCPAAVGPAAWGVLMCCPQILCEVLTWSVTMAWSVTVSMLLGALRENQGEPDLNWQIQLHNFSSVMDSVIQKQYSISDWSEMGGILDMHGTWAIRFDTPNKQTNEVSQFMPLSLHVTCCF